MKYISIKNDIKKSNATLIVANFDEDSISYGFFINVTIPMVNEIKEIRTNTLKSKFGGYKPVNGIRIKEREANIPQTTLSLNPNSRAFQYNPSYFVS